MRNFVGRGDKIRTCDFYLPKVALYQAELHPDLRHNFQPVAGHALGVRIGEPRMIAAGPPGRNRVRVESARL